MLDQQRALMPSDSCFSKSWSAFVQRSCRNINASMHPWTSLTCKQFTHPSCMQSIVDSYSCPFKWRLLVCRRYPVHICSHLHPIQLSARTKQMQNMIKGLNGNTGQDNRGMVLQLRATVKEGPDDKGKDLARIRWQLDTAKLQNQWVSHDEIWMKYDEWPFPGWCLQSWALSASCVIWQDSSSEICKWILRQLPNQVTTNEIQNLLLLKIGVLKNWI